MTKRVLAAALLALGAAALAAGWAGWLAMAVLVGAALAPYAALLLLVRLRVPISLAPVGPLALMGAGGYLVVARTGVDPRDAVPRLLSAASPAPPTPDLLLPGVAVAALVGLWVGVRVTRSGAVAPLAGAATLYTGGAMLTAGRSDRYGLVGAALVGLALTLWIADSIGPRRALWGVPVLAALAVGTAALMPASGGFEPRRLIHPPPLTLAEPNPLLRLATWAQQGDVVLLRRTGPALRMRLVALADFDGSAWRTNGRYRPVGAVAAADLPPGPHRSTVDIQVTVAGLDGLWVPTPGTPGSSSLAGVRVDADSGTALLPAGLHQGLRYRIDGTVDAPEDADLTAAGVPVAGRYLAVPRLPYLFAAYAQRIVRGASTPFEQAVLIESAVREGRRLDPTAPAGSSYARLSTFLFSGTAAGTDPEPGAQAGTSEQFAAAFAVIARAVGLPTRVVVGFRPGEGQPDGTWTIRGRDALAWPEVYFTGQGWVAFDPTPTSQDPNSPDEQVKRQVLDRLDAQPPPSPAPVAHPLPVPSPPIAGTPPVAHRAIAVPAPRTVGAAAVGVVALVVLGLLGGRTLRRLRHRRAGPRGAWSEVLDLLVLLRHPVRRDWTAPRIATDLSRRVPGAEPVLRLAEYADRAAFAPDPAGTANPWPELRRVRRAVGRAVPLRRKLIWPVDPRPLLRR